MENEWTSADIESLAIVVVNYGSSELLERNLVPLTRSLPAARVVVVDNFTSESERERVCALADTEGWLTVLPASNTGFGVGVNAGVHRAQQSGAGAFLLLNPDATIAADQVGVLLERVRTHPLTLVSPRIVRSDGSVWFDGADLYLDDGRIRATRRRNEFRSARFEPWLSGACLLLSDQLWSRVGGFSEEYFLYWEDVDFSYRVERAGGVTEVCRDAVAVHDEGGTQQAVVQGHGSPKSEAYYYYNIRNRLLFGARHLRSDDLRRWRRASLPIAWEVLLHGGRRQFLRSLRPLLAGGRGVRDGLTIARRELRARAE
ncbi:glycosyltransferase family 2 protein [Cryobacterium roopkundense]|uniref:glycosyltransferase family 2 protein n=1 Tax=Cryobacterium roopkundense TaxID=1001240 RepID=UPI000A66EA08|nr:glycosyltransferase family 2 protein [Cryobacterium roopkundense]